jgi:hypothetical protein
MILGAGSDSPFHSEGSLQSKLLSVANRRKKLKKIFPVTDFVVEDIKARTPKGKKKWNISFSPFFGTSFRTWR